MHTLKHTFPLSNLFSGCFASHAHWQHTVHSRCPCPISAAHHPSYPSRTVQPSSEVVLLTCKPLRCYFQSVLLVVQSWCSLPDFLLSLQPSWLAVLPPLQFAVFSQLGELLLIFVQKNTEITFSPLPMLLTLWLRIVLLNCFSLF